MKALLGAIALTQSLAVAYVESGKGSKEARALAETVLASNTVTNWNYGNIHYDMHSLLGRIALREGDVAGAKRHLVASGKTLKWIQLAKQNWALDKQKLEDATPTAEDLAGYLQGGRLPKCPDGGSYAIGKLNQNPSRSVADHELPKRTN
jgi:hypothetical protein